MWMFVVNDHQVYIFSYGSNMLSGRIRQRISSVEVCGVCELSDYKLVFNKRSNDLSSKANLVKSEGDSAHGVIHRMSLADRERLDQFEGLGMGYELEYFTTVLEGIEVEIGFYMVKDASFLCDDQPYHWYHECVLYGAMENRLCEGHVNSIGEVAYKVDRDADRNAKYDALLAGYRKAYKF